MRALGSKITFRQSVWMIATTQIGKYLPGRVWYMLGRVYVGKKENIRGNSLALSMILETCLLVVTGLTIFLMFSILAGQASNIYTTLSVLAIIVALVLLHPRVLTFIINVGLKIFNKAQISVDISFGRMLYISVFFFGLWFAQIIGLFFLVNAIIGCPIKNILILGAAHTLSWAAGFMVLLAPSGLGVREGVMTLMLSPVLPAPLAIAISFISRIWITIFEIIIFFIGLAVRRSGNDSKSKINDA